MSMVTSCPACTTTFRISQDQLKARQGKVRCGQCKDIFDAFKTLASLPDEPLLEPPAQLVDFQTVRSSGLSPRQSVLDIGPAYPAVTAQPARIRSNAGVEPARNRYVVIAIGLLATILVLQMLYALRAPIAAAAPALRPAFASVCAYTGCLVPLPRRTEVLAIESSDLQADAGRAGVIVLTAALRNRGSSVVEHPALELTLTNAQDQAIARRIFLPKEYLDRASDAAAGMAALAEINVRIELDTGELKAAGYRLFLFYP